MVQNVTMSMDIKTYLKKFEPDYLDEIHVALCRVHWRVLQNSLMIRTDRIFQISHA